MRKNLHHTEAAMLLMQIYSQNLHQNALAYEVLVEAEQRADVPKAYVEFARRSLNEWAVSRSKRPKNRPRFRSPSTKRWHEDLWARSSSGWRRRFWMTWRTLTLRLKLMEVQAIHCQNLQRANKMLRDLAADPHFNRHQVEIAKAKVRAWYAAASKTGGA